MSKLVAIANEESSSNVQAFIELRLLNCDLKGTYHYQVIKPDNEEETTEVTKTKIVVLPTSPEPKNMPLVQLIKEINDIIASFGGTEKVSVDSMKETLESMGLKSITGLEVQIRQLFIYVDQSSDPNQTKTFEYAFNFVILNEIKPEDSLALFHIEKLGLAVYNTKRKKIIERMQLEDINELLA